MMSSLSLPPSPGVTPSPTDLFACTRDTNDRLPYMCDLEEQPLTAVTMRQLLSEYGQRLDRLDQRMTDLERKFPLVLMQDTTATTSHLSVANATSSLLHSNPERHVLLLPTVTTVNSANTNHDSTGKDTECNDNIMMLPTESTVSSTSLYHFVSPAHSFLHFPKIVNDNACIYFNACIYSFFGTCIELSTGWLGLPTKPPNNNYTIAIEPKPPDIITDKLL